MITINATGAMMHAELFIQCYWEARKLAPARFLTLRLTPAMYKSIEKASQAPEVIQIGSQPGPLGTLVQKIACVKPANGTGDGITIVQDEKADPNRLVFEIHGSPELEVINLA